MPYSMTQTPGWARAGAHVQSRSAQNAKGLFETHKSQNVYFCWQILAQYEIFARPLLSFWLMNLTFDGFGEIHERYAGRTSEARHGDALFLPGPVQCGSTKQVSRSLGQAAECAARAHGSHDRIEVLKTSGLALAIRTEFTWFRASYLTGLTESSSSKSTWVCQ